MNTSNSSLLESPEDCKNNSCENDTGKKPQREGYKWYLIDRNAIFMKLAFLFESAKRGTCISFFVVYFIDLGLTKTQAGFITGLSLTGGLIGGIFWGMLADKTKMNKLLLTIQNVGSVLCMSLHILVDIYLTQRPQDPQITNSSQTRNVTVTAKFEQTTAQNNTSKIFIFVLFINILISFFDGNVMGFVNTVVVRKIDVLPYRCIYGHQSVFLALGYVVGFFLTTVLSNWVFSSINCMSQYTAIVIAYASSVLCLHIATFILYKELDTIQRCRENDYVSNRMIEKSSKTLSKEKTNILKILYQTVKQPSLLFFIAVIFAVGVEGNFHYTYLVLYLQDMGAPVYLPTLIFAATSASGVITFVFGEKIIQICRGVWNTFILVFVFYSIRYVLYGTVKNPWVILAAQCFNSYCIAIIVKVFHISRCCPNEILTTMFGIGSAVYFNISVTVGNICGGYVYEKFGGEVMYNAAAIFSFIWALLIFVYVLISKSKRKKDFNTKELEELKR